jgi:hypothetical protein
VFTVAFALDTFSNSGIRSTDPAKDAGNFCMSVLDGFIDQVKGYIYLPTKKEFYSPGKSNKAICGNVDLTFRMLVLRIDFNI